VVALAFAMAGSNVIVYSRVLNNKLRALKFGAN